MSGHSKWNNIKRKKEKTDGAKAKIFTKMGREIAVAVKEGGGADPASNSKLKDAIAKAKANNVPNDNIERVIKKAAGEVGGDNYEALQYEGYGPSGIAVIVETLTDNRNRTAGDMRHYFDKYGGNLGQTGCVSFMFQKKGVLVIEAEGLDEEKVMEDALEAGASDFSSDGDVFELSTEPNDFSGVLQDLTAKGYTFLSAEVQQVPDMLNELTDPDAVTKMEKLLDAFPDDEEILLLNISARISLAPKVDFERRVKLLSDNFRIINEAFKYPLKKYTYFLYYRGLTQLGMGNPEAAEVDFKACLETDPNFELAILMLKGLEKADQIASDETLKS